MERVGILLIRNSPNLIGEMMWHDQGHTIRTRTEIVPLSSGPVCFCLCGLPVTEIKVTMVDEQWEPLSPCYRCEMEDSSDFPPLGSHLQGKRLRTVSAPFLTGSRLDQAIQPELHMLILRLDDKVTAEPRRLPLRTGLTADAYVSYGLWYFPSLAERK